MRSEKMGRAVLKSIRDIDRKHLLAFSGSLACYYFLSLLPLLTLLASGLAYVPIPHVFDQILVWMSYFVPADSMELVRKVLADVMSSRNSGFLSIGILGTIWAASGASAAMIEALNVAYDVKEGRPFWHTRLLAIGLTFILGILVSAVLAAMILGPRWGAVAAHRLGLDPLFTESWFYFRWVLAISFAVLGVETLYYLAPNVEQRKFLRTIPGAVIAVTTWIIASYGFGLYLQHFGQFSKSYGTLAAVAALLLEASGSTLAPRAARRYRPASERGIGKCGAPHPNGCPVHAAGEGCRPMGRKDPCTWLSFTLDGTTPCLTTACGRDMAAQQDGAGV